MTVSAPNGRRRPPRRPWARPLVAVVLAAAAFLLGVAFSRTLDQRPRDGGLVTTVRTLDSLPSESRSTVTVTVTAP